MSLKPRSIRIKESSHPVLEGPPSTSGMKSGHVLLKAGQSCGRHSTREREEAIVVLKGKGTIEFEGHDPLPVEAGSVIYVPPATFHDVRNEGEQDLNYVYVVAPVFLNK